MQYFQRNQAVFRQRSPARILSSADSNSSSQDKRNTIVILALIGLVCCLAYSSVIFNFFIGDDFVHLVWLKQAVKNPELILRNFHSSWLDGTNTKFYRPLISVFMVTDYLIAGSNGIIFHITNLLFLLASAALLFYICKNLQSSLQLGKSLWFPSAAAALFALYPLHPETVSWITGRVDSVVTVFFLASFWCYMRWRAGTASIAWPIAFLIAALFSKEMAIVLPAVCLVYEGTIVYQWKTFPTFKSILAAILPALPFWGVLVCYFALRFFALGTFVGGYDDSLTFISNWHNFIGGWLHGLRMVFIPINRDLIGDRNVLSVAWQITMGLTACMCAYNVWSERQLRRAFAFLFFWSVLCFAPVYKLFAIADDLQSSRLAYLATVPICATLALAFIPFTKGKKLFQTAQKIVCAVLLVLAASLLMINNQPWALAGHESNDIRAGLQRLYETIPGDPQVMLVGLPDQIHGAYICRNALPGMTQTPQFYRTIQNCLMVNKFEPVLPFGFLKNSMAEHQDKIVVARWDQRGRSFIPVNIPDAQHLQAIGPTSWSGTSLQAITYGDGGTKLKIEKDGSIFAFNNAHDGRPSLSLSLPPIPCFKSDFLRITLAAPQLPNSKHEGAELLFTNDLTPKAQLENRLHSKLTETNHVQTILFSLRSLPDWILGGNVHDFKIMFPENSQINLSAVELVPADKVMPIIDFKNSDYMGTKGFMHLGTDQKEGAIDVDATAIDGAAAVEFEITRPNLLFAMQNTSDPSTVTMSKLNLAKTKGTFVIERKLFPTIGMYEGRAWAVDRKGNRIGVAGDHIVFAVDS